MSDGLRCWPGYTGATNHSRLTAGATGFQNSMLGLTATTGDRAAGYTRTPNGDLITQRVAGVSHYYLTDNLGSIVGLVDTTGTKTAAYAYDPYGVTRVATGTAAAGNPLRYTGQHLDSQSGLYKLGVRYYDPSNGRFKKSDPTSQVAHYVYDRNNLINYIDRSGGGAFLDLVGGVANGIANGTNTLKAGFDTARQTRQRYAATVTRSARAVERGAGRAVRFAGKLGRGIGGGVPIILPPPCAVKNFCPGPPIYV